MPRIQRRHADGSLDIGYHRRRARRLRRMAQRRLARALARLLGRMALHPIAAFRRLSRSLGAPAWLTSGRTDRA